MSDPKSPSIDLHGLKPQDALRRLSQGLHQARVRGQARATVITGRGWGNQRQEPVLRGQVEAWLRGPEGKRAGVHSFQRVARGGALDVRLSSARRDA